MTPQELQDATLTTRVVAIREVATNVHSYELVSTDTNDLPPFTAGAHIDVYLPNGLVRQYSLCNDPEERSRYVLGVLRDPISRGGSECMHDQVHVGAQLTISQPRNNFPLAAHARRSILIAGGIGITPMLAMAYRLERTAGAFEFHVCTRTPGSGAVPSCTSTPRTLEPPSLSLRWRGSIKGPGCQRAASGTDRGRARLLLWSTGPYGCSGSGYGSLA